MTSGGWQSGSNVPDVISAISGAKDIRFRRRTQAFWAVIPAKLGGFGLRQRTSAPFPSYSLSNNNAEIRRVKERIKQLEESANAEHVDQDRGVCRYVEDPELNRVQLFFDGKPPADTRTILKQNGFRFSKRDGNAWQRLLNANGKHAAEYVISQLQQEAEKCPT